MSEIEAIKKGKKDYMPMTLEGCVVRFADVIAYLGRDLLDAREVGLIKDDSDIPEQCKEKIGVENSEMINNLIINLIENSYGQNYISYSKEMSEALEKYLTFNYEQIYVGQYKHEERLGDEERIGNMYEKLFETFLGDLEDKNKKSTIYKQLFNLKWIGEDYLNKSTHPAEKVRDFIAGMTDKYFLTTFKDISIPKKITQKFK